MAIFPQDHRGSNLPFTHLGEDADVELQFKSEQNASAAHQAIRNYLEVADVEARDEPVMQMLELLFASLDDAGRTE